MIIISSNFFFNFTNFYAIVSFFLTKLITLDDLFSIAVRAVIVTKLVVLGNFFMTSCILALRVVVLATLVILGILFLTSFILALRVAVVAKLYQVFFLQYF